MGVRTAAITTKPRRTARPRAISPGIRARSGRGLRTVQDVLNAIQRSEPESSHLFKMLSSTVVHIIMHLHLPAERIEIGVLLNVKPGLQAYLKAKGFKRNSIRSYTNYLRILLQKAAELGWLSCPPEIAAAWQPILAAVAKSEGCSGVVRYAIQRGKVPTNFTDEDLDHWCEELIRNGRTYNWVVGVKGRFRKALFQAGLSSQLPKLQPFVTDRIYGIPLSSFPDDLREEVLDLIRYKTAETSPGRPYTARHRPVTANVGAT